MKQLLDSLQEDEYTFILSEGAPKSGPANWKNSYNGGAMDGACNVVLNIPNNCSVPACQAPIGMPYCPEYSYVSFPVSVSPYFDIAHRYGFCNYCFQTNQGPSFPAHQFLFGGTSLPKAFPDSKYKWFAADNPVPGGLGIPVGCIALATELVSLVDTNGVWPNCVNQPTNPSCMYPCLYHKTLIDVFGNSVSWKYYPDHGGTIWDAPVAVFSTCGPDQPPPNGTSCTAQAYTDHVVQPAGDHGRILTAIEDGPGGCTLANVSWVIPDGKWSDHAGRAQGNLTENHDGGPSWVSRIINAVGQSTCSDSINGQNVSYWNDTVILVVWDDWGGWYDHVSPNQATGGPGIGYPTPGTRDASWYVYGFRVPMLVISAYNKHTPGSLGYTGYVSGSLLGQSGPVCPGPTCHDFGSILNFIEFVFGSGGSYLGTIGDTHSDYSDALAPDAFPSCPQGCPYSLSDFFNFSQNPTAFVPITGMKYAETCFHNPNQTGCWPGAADADPDDDADEN